MAQIRPNLAERHPTPTRPPLRYLGRYTHGVAISSHRLVSFDGQDVAFRWTDRKHGHISRILELSATEFRRSFLLHILPRSFVRRHFGFMANASRTAALRVCRQLLRWLAGHRVFSPPRKDFLSGRTPDYFRVVPPP